MRLRIVKELQDLSQKTVLIRVDYNVSLGANGKVDPWEEHRIDATIPTIELLLKRGARVLLLAHLGRPEGKVVKKLRLAPIAERLQKILNGKARNKVTSQLPLRVTRQQLPSYVVTKLPRLFPAYEIVPSRVWLLENLRFDPREEENDRTFAKQLASLGDVYVNDAFAVSHRKHASVHAITKYLPSHAGLLMEQEVAALSGVLEKPRRPLVVIMGGAKMSTKIGLIKKFAQHADAVLLGGGIANTFFAARGDDIGKSLYEPQMIREARALLKSKKILLPLDVVRSDEQILDIGEKTREQYASMIARARSIIWNGPLGLIENKKFRHGTDTIIEAVIKNNHASSIIGGGETVMAFQQYRNKTTPYSLHPTPSHIFLSTGGGAMLEFLEQGTLPGIEPLRT